MKKKKKIKIWSSHRADIEFSHFIRDRDKGHCYFCPNPGSQNSHFWGRRASSTRYDPLNCDYVSGDCHFRHEGNKQGLYREMKIQQLGEEGYKTLEKKARTYMKRRDAIIECMKLLNKL